MKNSLAGILIPGVLAVVSVVLLGWWAGAELAVSLDERKPGMDDAPTAGSAEPLETPTWAVRGRGSAAPTSTPSVTTESPWPGGGLQAAPGGSGP